MAASARLFKPHICTINNKRLLDPCSRLVARQLHHPGRAGTISVPAALRSSLPALHTGLLSREALESYITTVEHRLPGMTVEELAETLETVASAHGYAAAEARNGSAACSLLDYTERELPEQSFLLSWRTALWQWLADHPAAISEQAAALRTRNNSAARPSRSAATGGASDSSDALTAAIGAAAAERTATSAGRPTISAAAKLLPSLSPVDLSRALEALSTLPIMVVQPLPIGFGTPRWSRPLAAADPAAWEAFLADVGAVWAAEEQLIAQSAAASSSEPPLAQRVTDLVVSLACCMRWANVNVDDDRVRTTDFRQAVLHELTQSPAAAADTATALRQQRQQQHLQESQHNERRNQQQQQQQQLQPCEDAAGLLLAGGLAHQMASTMLRCLLPPPRPLLAAFYDATGQHNQFTLREFGALARGCLYLGEAPPEPWLAPLVDAVRRDIASLPQRDLQGFLEAFRFFSTQRRASWLRDATAQLQEFTLA
jgi:hypothetical protein